MSPLLLFRVVNLPGELGRMKTSLLNINFSNFGKDEQSTKEVAQKVHKACREYGFFYVSGHGVSTKLQSRLEDLSQNFFKLDNASKMKIHMRHGGRFWRGYFPVGEELTSGVPDLKEGLYFGEELPLTHPSVRQNIPMHGPNIFPDVPEFKETVLDYMSAMTHLGHTLLESIALSLGLRQSYFFDLYTKDPLTLFRIFRYPHVPPEALTANQWGVGAHTDYGLLTILKQDSVGGLQIKLRDGWVDAPPVENTFVVNIGDMLDRVTGGLYVSTLHRVLPAKKDRLSFPFFFDPNFFSTVHPIREVFTNDAEARWDNQSVHSFKGKYGDYILSKVGKVFPQLMGEMQSKDG